MEKWNQQSCQNIDPLISVSKIMPSPPPHIQYTCPRIIGSNIVHKTNCLKCNSIFKTSFVFHGKKSICKTYFIFQVKHHFEMADCWCKAMKASHNWPWGPPQMSLQLELHLNWNTSQQHMTSLIIHNSFDVNDKTLANWISMVIAFDK